jgi:large subunit ribosomal protein L10
VNREEKKQSVSLIKDMVANNSAVIVVYYQGLTAAKIHGLRSVLLDSGAKMKVIKNSLAKLAIADTDVSGFNTYLSGPTALVVSNDPVSMAKTLAKFAKQNESLVLLGGVVDKQIIDKNSIALLADMPSKDELRAKIIGLISAPATKLVRLLNTPATQVTRVIDSYSKK